MRYKKELDILEDICLQVYGIGLRDLGVESFEHLNEVLCSLNWLQRYKRVKVEEVKDYHNSMITCGQCTIPFDLSDYPWCPICNPDCRLGYCLTCNRVYYDAECPRCN